eukprot:304372-Chlamydomonas_euryale.AAC.1
MLLGLQLCGPGLQRRAALDRGSLTKLQLRHRHRRYCRRRCRRRCRAARRRHHPARRAYHRRSLCVCAAAHRQPSDAARVAGSQRGPARRCASARSLAASVRGGRNVLGRGFTWLARRMLGRLRHAVLHPRMCERLLRRYPLGRIPGDAGGEEVEEAGIGAAQRGRERARARVARLALRIHGEPGGEVGVEEELGAARRREQVAARHVEQLHDALQLVGLVLSGEERVAGVQLREDASKAPHVDGGAVLQPQDDFGRSVEARLDVRVHPLVRHATAAKVDDLDDRAIGLA